MRVEPEPLRASTALTLHRRRRAARREHRTLTGQVSSRHVAWLGLGLGRRARARARASLTPILTLTLTLTLVLTLTLTLTHEGEGGGARRRTRHLSRTSD